MIEAFAALGPVQAVAFALMVVGVACAVAWLIVKW